MIIYLLKREKNIIQIISYSGQIIIKIELNGYKLKVLLKFNLMKLLKC